MSLLTLNKTLHHSSQSKTNGLMCIVSQNQTAMIAIKCQMDSGTYILNLNLYFQMCILMEILVAFVVMYCIVIDFAVLFDELYGFDDVGLCIEEQPQVDPIRYIAGCGMLLGVALLDDALQLWFAELIDELYEFRWVDDITVLYCLSDL